MSYNEEDRPSAQDLCHRLAALKETPQYGDSVQQEGSRPAESTGEDKERHIRELQWEKDERVQQIIDLQQQLQISNGQIQELQEATRKKDRVIEVRERQLRELNQQMAASENSCGERPIMEQHEEYDEQVQGLQQLHINKSPIQAKDAITAAQREEIQQFKQELEQATHVVEKQNQELTQKLEANETSFNKTFCRKRSSIRSCRTRSNIYNRN